jgi:hypothetical protein
MENSIQIERCWMNHLMWQMCVQAESRAVDQRTAQPDAPGGGIEASTVPEPRGSKRGKENDPDHQDADVIIL